MDFESLRRGAFSASVYSSIFQAFNIFSMLLTTVLLTRTMSVDDFATYVLIFSAIVLLSLVATFGIPTFLLRELSASSKSRERTDFWSLILFSFSTLVLMLCATICICLFFYITYSDWLTADLAQLSVVFLIGKSFVDLHAGALVGLGQIKKGQLTQMVLPNGFFLVLLCVVLLSGQKTFSVFDVLAVQVLAYFASVLISGVWFFVSLEKFRPFKMGAIFKRPWFVESGYLCLVNGLAIAQKHLLILILGATSSSETVAIYRVAERVGGVATFLRAALERIMQPLISKGYSEGNLSEVQVLMRRFSVLNFAYTLALVIFFFFIGSQPIAMVFGELYAASWLPLLILLFGSAVASVFGFNGMILSMTRNTQSVIASLLVSVIAMIVFALLLIAPFGAVGASIVAGSYVFLTAALLWFSTLRKVGINISLLQKRAF